ncbi:M15 family metallopeptidase [Kribbella sp. NBC_00709]|uniref:M15 family metallopeptidase n=1 Tax=Kribbella sp. NBC_00709 TaxID=2975972 RepID=UPI002E2B5A2A|nr:M15 family metallopeptidase [Kribbella sp. NBC_00709]
MLTDHRIANRTTILAIVAAVTSLTLTSCAAASAQDDPSPSTAGPSGPPRAADGVLPDHTSAYDTSLPGIAKLDPALRKAVQQAETAMKDDGIKLQVTTGWRSKKYQEELLDKAIRKYGSKKKALEYVAEPDESHHVTGHAVDIGPTDADDWLNRHGNLYGLCQTLSNEIWHFELTTKPGNDCPPMTNPTKN